MPRRASPLGPARDVYVRARETPRNARARERQRRARKSPRSRRRRKSSRATTLDRAADDRRNRRGAEQTGFPRVKESPAKKSSVNAPPPIIRCFLAIFRAIDRRKSRCDSRRAWGPLTAPLAKVQSAIRAGEATARASQYWLVLGKASQGKRSASCIPRLQIHGASGRSHQGSWFTGRSRCRRRSHLQEVTMDDREIVSSIGACLAQRIGKDRYEVWFGAADGRPRRQTAG